MKARVTGHSSGIGGLAVPGGVMMRNKDRYAVAVRTEDGGVSCRVEHYRALLEGSVLLRIPFVRGIFVFIDSLRLSFRTMGESAEMAEHDEPKKSASRMSDVLGVLLFLVSFAFAIGLFIVAPYFIARFLVTYIRSEALLSVAEGLLRILIFVVYVFLISRMKEIRRLFGYHGAEHKCINCIEAGKELTVENVRESSRLHKRCGSSFVLFVMLISIIVFFFIRVDNAALRLLLRIILLPVISGIAYEIIRLAGSNDNALIRAISSPGFAMQYLTTREPDDTMIEVGIRSVEAVFDWKEYQKDTFGREYA